MSKTSNSLKYRRNWQLRQELVGIVKPERRHEYGPAASGIVKADLLEIAAGVGIEYEDTPTLDRIYDDLCEAAAVEAPDTAGQEWGLRRNALKGLIRLAGNAEKEDTNVE